MSMGMGMGIGNIGTAALGGAPLVPGVGVGMGSAGSSAGFHNVASNHALSPLHNQLSFVSPQPQRHPQTDAILPTTTSSMLSVPGLGLGSLNDSLFDFGDRSGATSANGRTLFVGNVSNLIFLREKLTEPVE